MSKLQLPDEQGRLTPYSLQGTPWSATQPAAPFNRVVFSAAHVVADPFSAREPSEGGSIDWDSTMAYRRYLAELGLGIAEAMDTSQRGMGLSWDDALLLIRRTHQALSLSLIHI